MEPDQLIARVQELTGRLEDLEDAATSDASLLRQAAKIVAEIAEKPAP